MWLWSQYTFLLRNAKTWVFGIQSWVVVNPKSCPLLFLYCQAAILGYFAALISWINIITLSSYSPRTCSAGKVQCRSSILTRWKYLWNADRKRRVFAWRGWRILSVPLPLHLSFLISSPLKFQATVNGPYFLEMLLDCSSGEIANKYHMLQGYQLL